MKLSTPCKSCLIDKKGICYTVLDIGIQEGIDFDLNLYNCVRCNTTRTERIDQKMEALKNTLYLLGKVSGLSLKDAYALYDSTKDTILRKDACKKDKDFMNCSCCNEYSVAMKQKESK